LQERLGNYGETSARDIFIATLSRIKEPSLVDMHPFLLFDRVPLLFTNEDVMKSRASSVAPDKGEDDPNGTKNLFGVLGELFRQAHDNPTAENARIFKAIMKLFIADTPKKSKKRKHNEEGSTWKVDACCVLQNQKFCRWINFIYELLANDSFPVMSLIKETLASSKLKDEETLPKKVHMCTVRIAKNLLLRGTLTSVNATDLKYGAFGGLYVLGGIYCDFVSTDEDRWELHKFFLCLPSGFGSYEKLYRKGFWQNSIPERLPFKEKVMEMSTIHLLGKIFFQCTNTIAEAVRLFINHQLGKREAALQVVSGTVGGKPKGLPTKKLLLPVVHRYVASAWLKILNCVGLVIHPTAQMREHLPGKKVTLIFCVFAKHQFFIVSIFLMFLCFDKKNDRPCNEYNHQPFSVEHGGC
jgi:hypothetical protein